MFIAVQRKRHPFIKHFVWRLFCVNYMWINKIHDFYYILLQNDEFASALCPVPDSHIRLHIKKYGPRCQLLNEWTKIFCRQRVDSLKASLRSKCQFPKNISKHMIVIKFNDYGQTCFWKKIADIIKIFWKQRKKLQRHRFKVTSLNTFPNSYCSRPMSKNRCMLSGSRCYWYQKQCAKLVNCNQVVV